MAGHRYTILTMMKDEGPDLLEWVAFHRMIGFDNICVFTNDCSDGTDAMLDRLAEMGELRRFDNRIPPGKKPQPHALTLAQKTAEVADSDWILVMDADEFLHVKAGSGRVEDLIAACPPKTDAIAVTWRIMGSNGLVDWHPGLVTESYTRGAPDGFRKGWGVKTLFRPFAHMKFGIHRPGVKQEGRFPERVEALADQLWVNGAGRPLPRRIKTSAWRSSGPTVGYDLAEMRHYAVKSAESFLLRGLRGNVNNKAGKYDATYFSIFDRNETPRDDLLPRLPALKARIADYLKDPVLAGLQADSMAHHAARIAGLRAEAKAHAARLAELQAAAAVPFEALDEVLYVQPLPPQSKAAVRRMQQNGIPDAEIARIIARNVARLERQLDEEDAAELARMGVA